MPSINRRGNSRTPACCPKFPNTSCCAHFGSGTSGFRANLQSLDGFSAFQFGTGGTASAGPDGLVVAGNLGGELTLTSVIPIITPSTDEYCICFDLSPDAVSNIVFGGLGTAMATQVIEVSPGTGGKWFLFVVGPSFVDAFDTGIPVVAGVFTSFKICRLPGSPPEAITLTIGNNPPQQFVVSPGSVPNVPLSILYDAFSGSVVRSTSFCANFRTAPVSMESPPLGAVAPQAILQPSFPAHRAMRLLGLPID